MERPWQACLLLTLAALAFPPGCGRKQALPPAAPRTEEPAYQPAPWTWHKVGGVLVVTGEVLAPMEVTLTGRYMNERVYAEPGPIRWEFYVPPAGEVVTLRTIEGKLLAKWNLDVPMAEPQVAEVPVAKAPVAALAKAVPWPETHLPLPEGRAPEGRTPEPPPAPAPWNPIHPAAPQVAALPSWPETHLPLAKGVPPPTKAPTPPRVLPAVPQVAAMPRWPETHLPLQEGRALEAPPAPAPWNPIHPAVSQVAALPSWPETHLPLAKGVPPAVKAPIPSPVLPVAPQVAALPPWPETHLPLGEGRALEAPPAPAPWNPIHPAVSQVAALPPWPETHLPLAKGPFRRPPIPVLAAIPAPPPLPKVASGPPWPETHLPPARGAFRITLSRPLVLPVEGFTSPAAPADAPYPGLRPLLAEAMARFWPDTHLPQAKGHPRPAPLVAAKPVAPPWPETHLPPWKGLFRTTLAQPLLVPHDAASSAALSAPALKPVVPVIAKVVQDVWPETHLPQVQGEPLKVATKAPPDLPPATAVVTAPVPAPVTAPVPAPAAEPAAPPVLPIPSTREWPGQGEAFNLIRGPRGSHWVCITFDGGSSDEVALDVLNALKERGIITTFFLTGDFIEKFPEIVRRIVRDGHEVGNHTMDHPHLAPGGKRDPRWTKERFQQQLLRADAAFLRLAGRPMDPYWRAPYGEQTTEIRKWAEELGYRHIAWSEGADTLDWATVKERKLYRTGNAILDRLHERMERQDGDGLIVLMHLGSARPEGDRPARVLGPFLDQVLDEGWNFVNIGAYLKEAGKVRWDASIRLAMLAQRTAHP